MSTVLDVMKNIFALIVYTLIGNDDVYNARRFGPDVH